MKPKKCKADGCGTMFTPYKPMQKCCSVECEYKYALKHLEKKRERRRKEEKKKVREAKKRLKTRSQWAKEAQIAFNRYIRLRDKNEPCISCGKNTGAKMNAGHYLSVGAHPELRYNELNCHKQCEHCNSFLSGNIAKYRINLVEKIGLEKVEWLEGPHEVPRRTAEYFEEIKRIYTEKAKKLEKDE